MKSKITLILVLFGLETFAQSNIVSAGSTSYSAGYEISETYGQVFRFYSTLSNNFTLIEGIQQPFINSNRVSIKEWVNQNIKVYPIPSTGELTIECPSGIEFKLYNSAGQLVKEFFPNNSISTLNLTEFAAGTYIAVFLESNKYLNHQNIILK